MSLTRFSWPVIAAAAAVVIGGATPSAEAAFRLRIEDLGTGRGVVFSDPGNTGILSYSGSMGAGSTFTVNFTVGLRQPPVGGGSGYADIHLNSLNVATSGAGRLRIVLESDGFTQGPIGTLSLQSALGGVLSGAAGSTVTFQSWANSLNAMPSLGADSATPTILAALGATPAGSTAVYGGLGLVVGLGSFNDTSGTSFVNGGTYSLFSSAIIDFTGSGTVSFDQVTETNPAPAGLVLAATGLPFFGLGYLRRRWKGSTATAE